MNEWKCPECHNGIPEDDINTETGMAQCSYCGNVVNQTDLVDTTSENGTGMSFREYQPPESARHQILKNEDGVLQLYLPNAGFQLGTIFNVLNYGVLILVFLIATLLFFPQMTNFFAVVVPLIFIGIPAYRLATRINRATQTETLEISNGQLKLGMRRPLGPNSLNTFDLSEIQGVEYQNEDAEMNKVGIKMPRMFIDNTRRAFYYRAYVVTGDDEEVFFMQDDPEAKEWLAGYLNNLIKNHHTTQAE